jgi:hypothetical protein
MMLSEELLNSKSDFAEQDTCARKKIAAMVEGFDDLVELTPGLKIESRC